MGNSFFDFIRMEFQFKHFSLNHSRSTMKVGTDAVLLSGVAPHNRVGKILDIGTGCGVVAMLMAQFNPHAHVTAIDIDHASTQQAAENFAQSPYHDRLQVINTKFQDFASNPDNHNSYSLIVSNPPYFVNSLNAPQQRRHLARHTDMLPFPELVGGILKIIAPFACVTLILPPIQSEDVRMRFEANGMHLVQQTEVLSKSSKPVERIINTYSTIAHRLETSTITIRQNDNTYTSQYKNLVSDILL